MSEIILNVWQAAKRYAIDRKTLLALIAKAKLVPAAQAPKGRGMERWYRAEQIEPLVREYKTQQEARVAAKKAPAPEAPLTLSGVEATLKKVAVDTAGIDERLLEVQRVQVEQGRALFQQMTKLEQMMRTICTQLGVTTPT